MGKLRTMMMALQVLVGPTLLIAQATAPPVLVSGVVTDSAGVALSHASVSALPRGDETKTGNVGSRLNPWVRADDNGRFIISLQPGRYKIQAKDEADGYPDPVFALNDDSSEIFPELVVEQRSISGVRVVLGKRGGVLEGRLLDESGNPINHGKVTIRDARSPEAYVEVFTRADGHFQFTVPDKPVVVTATASGYRSTTSEHALTLSDGERRSLVFKLEPN